MPYLDLVTVFLVVVDSVDRLLHLAQHQVAVAIVGLRHAVSTHPPSNQTFGSGAYMKLALELSVAAQLDENDLVQQQSHEIERLGHVSRLLPNIRHGCMSIVAFCMPEPE